MKAKGMEKDYILIRMVKYMMDNGKMEKGMEKEY